MNFKPNFIKIILTLISAIMLNLLVWYFVSSKGDLLEINHLLVSFMTMISPIGFIYLILSIGIVYAIGSLFQKYK